MTNYADASVPPVSPRSNGATGDTGATPAFRDATRRRRRQRMITAAVWAAAAVITLLVLVAVLFRASGGSWFIVETPSMGTAAPVGTLVLDQSTTIAALKKGDIISFHPPTEPNSVYTHRVFAISDSGASAPPATITTKGDINGGTDPWRLEQKDLIGKATAVLPGVGWLIRAIPIILVGSVLVWLVARLFRSRTTRSAVRIIGFSLVFSLASFILRPFDGIAMLMTEASGTGAKASVVSTGLLPISVRATGGTAAHLVSGSVGTVTVPDLSNSGHYQLASSLDLGLVGWLVFGLICAIPLLWVFIVGLPRDDLEATA